MGKRQERYTGGAQSIFRAVKILFIIIMDTPYYIFVQTYRMHNSKVNPKVIYRFWVIIMC